MPRLSRIGILADISENIEKGHWKAGHRLPSASKLAAWYGVSESTITWAMSILTRERRIFGVAGQARYVAGAPPVDQTVDLIRADPDPSNPG